MKKYILIAVLLLCVGCLPASQQEVQTLTGEVTKLLGGVDTLQATTQQLATDGLINKEKVDKINAGIDKVQEQILVVVKDVETAPDVITGIEKGWSATEPFNPYYGYGLAVLSVLKLLQTTKTKKVVEDKYTAMKVGVEKTRNEATIEEAAALYKNIGDARKAKGIA